MAKAEGRSGAKGKYSKPRASGSKHRVGQKGHSFNAKWPAAKTAKKQHQPRYDEDGEEIQGSGAEDYDEDGQPMSEAEEEAEEVEGKGVNKIKASIRQTKRLLAKDKLSALSRQEAERRLVALEDELLQREASQRERKNAKRYHHVRFFERQKLTRKINKLKKQLQSTQAAGDADKKQMIERDLRENRILLNYVLHYPMTQKYVALFPNSGPSPLDKDDAADAEDSTASHKRMQEVRRHIIKAMDEGELSEMPDVELEQRAGVQQQPVRRLRTADGDKDIDEDDEDDDDESVQVDAELKVERKRKSITLPSSTSNKKAKNKRQKDEKVSKETAKSSLQDDDFFAL